MMIFIQFWTAHCVVDGFKNTGVKKKYDVYNSTQDDDVIRMCAHIMMKVVSMLYFFQSLFHTIVTSSKLMLILSCIDHR